MNTIGHINIPKPQYFTPFLAEQAKNIVDGVNKIENEFKALDNTSVDSAPKKGDLNIYSYNSNFTGQLKTDKKTGETESFSIIKRFYNHGEGIEKAHAGDGTFREIHCTKNDLGNGNVEITRTVDFAQARGFEKHIETIVYNKNTGEIQSLNSNHDF